MEVVYGATLEEYSHTIEVVFSDRNTAVLMAMRARGVGRKEAEGYVHALPYCRESTNPADMPTLSPKDDDDD